MTQTENATAMLQVKYISSVKSRKQRKHFHINCEFDSPGELMKTSISDFLKQI